jgi:hypothetical protein
MTEPDQIEFHEHVNGPDGGRAPGPSLSRSIPVRIGMVAGSAVLFVIGAVAAMGASPSPTTPAATTDSGTTPAAPVSPFDGALPRIGPLRDIGLNLRGGIGFKFGGFGDITIASINGSNLSLKTDDGWTRTIAVGSSTTITKGGQTISVGDLKAGDQIVFRETKGTDGSYAINEIRVVLPVVGGKVTAVGSDSITIETKGGASATIHVTSSTTYDVNGNASAKLSDITVGSVVIAEGTLRSDGSLDASTVHAGTRIDGGPGWMGKMFRAGPNHVDKPEATPSASPSTSSSVS